MFENRLEKTFIEGFSYWNDGHRRIQKHGESNHHLESVAASGRTHSSANIDTLLDNTVAQSKLDNHDMLVYVIDSIKYLTRQGQALRGSHQSGENFSEPNSNLWQSLCLQSKRADRVDSLMNKRINFCSPEVQNELLSIMGQSIQRKLAKDIRDAPFFTIMVDEASDVTSKEQAAICFR